MSLDGKRAVFRNESLPWERCRTVEKLGERGGVEAADEDINTLRRAKPQIRARDGGFISLKNDSAVNGGKPFVAERVDFFA